MTLRSLLGAANRKLLSSVYRRMIPLGDRGPIVSFGFDDFPRSAYLVGGAILESFGARGTYYAAAGLMNTSNGLGDICTDDDLHSLLAKGHELGTQTFEHSSCRKVSLAYFEKDVRQGIEVVERLTGHQARGFAYPYGHVTVGTKKAFRDLSSVRSIYPGINGPDIDLNLLLANHVYGDMDVAASLGELIRQNIDQKGWLIFYTHDVRPNPSEYGCTPALFEFAVSESAKSGARILTIGQVLQEMGLAAGQTAPEVRPISP